MNSSLLVKRALGHSWTRAVLLIGYVLVLLVLFAPVLFTSVGADDSYWILEKGHESGGSYWTAFWDPLRHAFDFSGNQPRTTALAFSERSVLAMFTLEVSAYFSIPPFVVWAAVKIALLLLMIGATVVFLRQLTFRDRQGTVRHLGSSSIAFIATALPLTIALGVKTQDVATFNGWNHYPTLTYGPYAFLLLFAAMTLRASTLLQRNYRMWAAPVLVAMALMGLILNLSYELLAVAVPLVILVIVCQPRPDETSRWMRWRAGITVLGGLIISYSTLFLWIRWRISRMDCQATDSCYAGAVVQVEPRTLWNNFIGSFPGGNGAFVSKQAEEAGRAFPGINLASVALAVLATALMLAVCASWSTRRRSPVAEDLDTRGLLMVLLVSVSIAVGATAVTGITARAIDQLETSMISYRTNVVTWSALSLAAVTVVRLLMISGWRFVRPVALGGLSLVLVIGLALYFPRNVMTAQVNRVESGTELIDALQREVALGDLSTAGDKRRCRTLGAYLDDRDEVSDRISRTVIGAQDSFEFMHHRSFCADGIPEVVHRVSNRDSNLR